MISSKHFSKALLISILFSAISMSTYSQDKAQKGGIDVSLGISDYSEFLSFKSVLGVYHLNLNYRISSCFSAGVDLGYGGFKSYGWNTGSMLWASTFLYSLNGYFHLTPMVAKKPNPRFDVYLKGKIGGNSINIIDDDSPYQDRTELDWGVYAGCKFRILQSAGIYTEVGYGKYTFTQFGLYVGIGK